MNRSLLNSFGMHASTLWTSLAGNATTSSALNAQIEQGFLWLRFHPALEQDFRHYLAASSQRSRVTMLLIGLFGVLIIPFIDQSLLGLPQSAVLASRWLQLGVMAPALVTGIGLCMVRKPLLLLEWAMVAVYFFLLGGLMGQRVVDSWSNFYMPLELVGLCTVAMFVLSRVRFWIMAPVALIATATALGFELWLVPPRAETPYHLWCSSLLLIIAICAGYSSEYFIRWTWLNGTLLRHMARVDGLTGLLNRPALEDAIGQSLASVRRERRPFSVAIVDIDGFGDYNDYYGHQHGDTALRKVAEVLGQRARRPLDVVGRYGGEEFVLLWIDNSYNEALALAEGTRAAVEKIRLAHAPGRRCEWVTISIGLCHVDAGECDAAFARALKIADCMLYAAKAGGRNVVRSSLYDADNADKRFSSMAAVG